MSEAEYTPMDDESAEATEDDFVFEAPDEETAEKRPVPPAGLYGGNNGGEVEIIEIKRKPVPVSKAKLESGEAAEGDNGYYVSVVATITTPEYGKWTAYSRPMKKNNTSLEKQSESIWPRMFAQLALQQGQKPEEVVPLPAIVKVEHNVYGGTTSLHIVDAWRA